MPPEHQDCQLHFSSSHHERTYILSSQECHKSIKTVSFIPAAPTIRELTSCQAKNATRASRLSASFQLQPLWKNLLSVKPRMPQEHQDCQLHSSSSHHERTYHLSSQECPKSTMTVSFIPAPATIRELTFWQAKNASRASRLSASFQLQPHERTYRLLHHTYHNIMKTMRNRDTRTDIGTIMIHFVSTKLPPYRLQSKLNSPPSYEETILR